MTLRFQGAPSKPLRVLYNSQIGKAGGRVAAAAWKLPNHWKPVHFHRPSERTRGFGYGRIIMRNSDAAPPLDAAVMDFVAPARFSGGQPFFSSTIQEEAGPFSRELEFSGGFR